MSSYYIQDMDHALGIISEYKRCRGCGECGLSTAEGWLCSHMYEQAVKYMKKHKEEDEEDENV